MSWIDDLIAKQKKRQTLLSQYQRKRTERFAPRRARFNPFREEGELSPGGNGDGGLETLRRLGLLRTAPPEGLPQIGTRDYLMRMLGQPAPVPSAQLPAPDLGELFGQRPSTTALATRPAPALTPIPKTPSFAELLGGARAPGFFEGLGAQRPVSGVSAKVTAPSRMPEFRKPVGELKPAPTEKIVKKAVPSDLPGASKLWLDQRARQKAIDAGENFYYSSIRGGEVSVAGYPLTRPVPTFEYPSLTGGEAERIVKATGQPYKGEMETVNPDTGVFPSDEGKPTGEVSPGARARERAAQSPNPIVRFANTPTVLFGLTPGDIAGIGAIITGGVAAIRSFTAFCRLPQYKAMGEFAKETKLPKDSPTYQSAKSALKTAYNLYKTGATEAADDIMAQFNKAYYARRAGATTVPSETAKAITPFRPTLAPKGTQTGAMAFGGRVPTPESVAFKIARGQALTRAEEQLRVNNRQAVETALNQLKATITPAPGVTIGELATDEQYIKATVRHLEGKSTDEIGSYYAKQIMEGDAKLEQIINKYKLPPSTLDIHQQFVRLVKEGKPLIPKAPVTPAPGVSKISTTPTEQKVSLPVSQDKWVKFTNLEKSEAGRVRGIAPSAFRTPEGKAMSWAEMPDALKAALGRNIPIPKAEPAPGVTKIEPSYVNLIEGQTLVNQAGERWLITGIKKEGVPARWAYTIKIDTEKMKLTRTVPLGEIERYYKIEQPAIPKAPVTPAKPVSEAIKTLSRLRALAKEKGYSITRITEPVRGAETAKFRITGITEGTKGEKSYWDNLTQVQSFLVSEPVKYPATPAGAEARAKAEGISISEASRLNAGEALKAPVQPAVSAELPVGEVPLVKPPAKPRAARVPPVKPPPPVNVQPMPEPTPPSGRPRTLADLHREAKGMRALKPDERAAVMDVARPISEDELLYKVKPFNEHADNLLQPDTQIRAALRAVPGVKQAAGLWTPAQMQRNNPIAMIGVRKQIFEEIEIGRARLATLNWWHDADEVFDFKRLKGKWRATNVAVTSSAQPSKPYHGTIHDLVEHPENYNFTPEQAKVLQIAQDMQRQILRDAQRAGVDAVELFNDYWRRIVIKAPSTKIDAKTRSRIAQRKGYTKQRVFDFVDEGAKAGYEYETHPLTALQNRLEAGIRTISDQNTRQAMARLPGVEKPLERLESRYPQTVEGAKTARQARDAAKQVFLRDKTVENETALRQAEADYIMAMKEVYAKKLEAGQPNIGELKLPNGRIAPAELVEEVRKWVDLPEIQTSVGAISSNVLEVTRLFRTTLTNVDLAAGFIQGQALFYRNNVAWWRAQALAFISLFDDPTAFVAKHFDLMDRGMRTGAISIPTEFMFTRQGLASIPTRIPVIGPLMKGFNRAFEWFIVGGQTYLLEAAESAVIKRAGGDVSSQKAIDALVSLGSAIRKELGTESYAILGVRPTQHTAEQLLFFAARFFRALTGFQAQAFTGGEGGHEARRALGSAVAGGLALLIAISYAKDRELPNLTDPFKPGWMSVKIGNTYFNPFGPLYPYFRTQARVSILVSQGKFGEAAKQLNWFLQSKAGLPLRGIDMAAQFGVKGYYTTFEGKTIPRTPLGIAEAALGEFAVPISIQEALKSIPEGRPEAAIGEVFGLVGRENYPYFPEEFLAPYFNIPSSTIEFEAAKDAGEVLYSRTKYRELNPHIDAALFLKGYVTTIKTPQAAELVKRIIREEGYDPLQLRPVKLWQEETAELKKFNRPDTRYEETDKLIRELLGLPILTKATPRAPAPVPRTPTPGPRAPAPTTPRRARFNPFREE